MSLWSKRTLQVAALAALFASCGKDSKLSNANLGSLKDLGKEVQVKVGLSSGSAGLGLTSTAGLADSFSVSVINCISTGGAGTESSARDITGASSTMTLIVGDRNCALRLNRFTVNGVTYSTISNQTYSWTTSASSYLKYQASNGSLAYILVNSQFPTTISATTNTPATFIYSFVNQGSTDTSSVTSVSASSSAPSSSVLGAEAPSFSLSASSVLGFTATGGVNFSFSFLCTQAMSGLSCAGVDTATLTYSLVQPSSSIVLPLDMSTVATAYNSSTGTRATVGSASSNKILNSAGTAYTGFTIPTITLPNVSTTDVSGVTTSAPPTYTQLKASGLVLILRNTVNGTSSYQYFSVTVN